MFWAVPSYQQAPRSWAYHAPTALAATFQSLYATTIEQIVLEKTITIGKKCVRLNHVKQESPTKHPKVTKQQKKYTLSASSFCILSISLSLFSSIAFCSLKCSRYNAISLRNSALLRLFDSDSALSIARNSLTIFISSERESATSRARCAILSELNRSRSARIMRCSESLRARARSSWSWRVWISWRFFMNNNRLTKGKQKKKPDKNKPSMPPPLA